MQALVVYYSRTGNTKMIAEELAKALQCDVEGIVSVANRSGPIGFVISGREGSGKKLARIEPVKKDPSKYDIVVIGTPIWARNMSSPVRTYLTENKAKFKNVAFFCTEGNTGSETAFSDMESITGKRPKATLTLMAVDIKGGDALDKVKKFADAIKA